MASGPRESNCLAAVRSLDFSNIEKQRLMGVMKFTVEKVRPLEHELTRLEAKADRLEEGVPQERSKRDSVDEEEDH